MTEHSVTLHHFPLPAQLELLHIDELVVGYNNSWSVDLGALCFLQRSPEKRKPKKGRAVDLISLCETRAKQIRSFAQAASDFYAFSGRRVKTIFNLHAVFAQFLDWCDVNSFSNALETKENAHASLRSYSEYLKEQVDLNKLHANTASGYQRAAIEVLETHFGFENLEKGIRKLTMSRQHVRSTDVPHEEAQEQVLAWCNCLFLGLSDLVVDGKPYPFALSVPEYLMWDSNRLWIFPLSEWCKTPNKTSSGLKNRAYDFENGRVRTEEQIVAMFGKRKFPASALVELAEYRITVANRDLRDFARCERALLAIQSFFLLFIAITGMNLSQAAELPWSEELDVSAKNPLAERQGFRTIKYRANNRKIAFELGVQHMPSFRRYLELRRYFLNGRTCDLLFVGGVSPSGEIKVGAASRSADQVQVFFNVVRRLCPEFPKVRPRQWRAAKQDFVIRHYDPMTAATAMQHSKETALKHYSNGSETLHQVEFRSYFDQVERVVIRQGVELGRNQANAIGACSSPSKPQTISNSSPIVPDCATPTGCLFCDKYRIHLDKLDLRKVLSARYFVRKTAAIAESHEQFERFFGVILQRIESILVELRRHDGVMVQEVEREVDIDGELDGYWEVKLELLAELDIL